MYRGFPLRMVSLLRCPQDDHTLRLNQVEQQTADPVWRAELECEQCGSRYPVVDGIVRMLDAGKLAAPSQLERTMRDEIAERADIEWEQTDWSQMEVQPTMEASEPMAHALVLELGAGTGRYTVEMARRQASILAVDFSLQSLLTLASRAEPEWNIGLVWADCTALLTQAAAFDIVASTLVSNLPTKGQRTELLRIAAHACHPAGKFVFGTHHYGMRSVIGREARSGRYPDVPIYRYLFRTREITREVRAFFGDVDVHPMVITFPFLARLKVDTVKLSRMSEHVPIVNQLGRLLLGVARKPIVGEVWTERTHGAKMVTR